MFRNNSKKATSRGTDSNRSQATKTNITKVRIEIKARLPLPLIFMKDSTRSTKDSYNKPRDKSGSWKISWRIAGNMKEAMKRDSPIIHLFPKNHLINRNMKIFRSTSCPRPTSNHRNPTTISTILTAEEPPSRTTISREGTTTRKKGQAYPETSIAGSWDSTETTRDPSPTTKSWDLSPRITSPTNSKDSTLPRPEISKAPFTTKGGM